MLEGVVVLIREGKDFLMIQEPSGEFEDCWAPVHGTVEENEEIVEAAEREVLEEVGLRVDIGGEDKVAETGADFKTETLHWFLTEEFRGGIEPDPEEVRNFEWLEYDEISERELLPQAEKFFQSNKELLRLRE